MKKAPTSVGKWSWTGKDIRPEPELLKERRKRLVRLLFRKSNLLVTSLHARPSFYPRSLVRPDLRIERHSGVCAANMDGRRLHRVRVSGDEPCAPGPGGSYRSNAGKDYLGEALPLARTRKASQRGAPKEYRYYQRTP